MKLLMPAPLPRKYQVTEYNRELRIHIRWMRSLHAFALGFATVWIGLVVLFYARLDTGYASPLIYFFPVIHVAFGAWIFYYAVCGICNTTTIRVTPAGLLVRHVPLPWEKNWRANQEQVHLLHVSEQTSHLKGAVFVTYDLYAITFDSQRIPLIKGIESLDYVRVLEKRISDTLFPDEAEIREAMAS